jgi:ketosteroid isomerase-like protein
MSQENVEVVRREYDALAARDWTTIAKLWHRDIELEADPSAPGAGPSWLCASIREPATSISG